MNDNYESDYDVPVVKENNKILHTNLTLIAIIAQASCLNVAIQPFETTDNYTLKIVDLALKFIPLLACSIWMSFNLRYEKDAIQYRKNTKIELVYCVIQLSAALFGYYSQKYFVSAVLLIVIASIYILWINPKYMNRQLARKTRKNR